MLTNSSNASRQQEKNQREEIIFDNFDPPGCGAFLLTAQIDSHIGAQLLRRHYAPAEAIFYTHGRLSNSGPLDICGSAAGLERLDAVVLSSCSEAARRVGRWPEVDITTAFMLGISP